MNPTFLVAATSLLTASLTASLAAYLSHFFARHRNREDDLHRIRIQSYVEYIGAAMRMALARRQKDEAAYLKELPIYNDAKAKICFCAPEPVLRCMIDFHSQGIDLEEEQRILALKHLCLAIRSSLVPPPGKMRTFKNWFASIGIGRWKMAEESAHHLDIAQVLFDLEPGKLPYGYSADLFPRSHHPG